MKVGPKRVKLARSLSPRAGEVGVRGFAAGLGARSQDKQSESEVYLSNQKLV
jgi:hypothetical protein